MSIITDNYTIDLGDDSRLTVTKRIYDINQPDKRQSHFTKTITVPSSATNDRVFASLFDVNFRIDTTDQFDPWFNPARKAQCILHTDTMEQLTGYAQLTDIVMNRYTNKVEYNLTLFGEIRDLFAELTNKKLSELDLSEYDHDWTETNISNSWDYTVKVNGVDTNYAEGGNGYIYPMVDYGDDHTLFFTPSSGAKIIISTDYWKAEHFRPWLYVKTIVDKIFQDSGFSYYSDFFNSSLFKKLIYQGDNNGLKKQDTEIEAYSINATKTTDTTYSGINAVESATDCYSTFPVIFNSETLDPAGQYNTTTGVVTIGASDTYYIGGSINATFTNSSGQALDGSVKLTVQGIKSDGTVLWSKVVYIAVAISTLGWTAGATKNFSILFNQTVPNEFTNGDQFKVCIRGIEHIPFGGSPQTDGVIDITIEDTGCAFYMTPVSDLTEGSNIQINSILDPEMTQKDFLMNIVKMFNLYIEPYWFREGDVNSGKYNQYLIEPRDDYFTNDVIDWTYNLDTNKDFVIKPLALVESKFFHFTYKEDNDYLNDLYKNQTGRIYGDYIHEIDNDFAKGTTKVEIGFSPCIMSDQQSTFYSRLMPVNIAQDGGTRVDGKPKILFYNGTIATADTWLFGTTQKSNYPLAHHVDDIFEPTCDLNFAMPPILYYRGNEQGELVLTNGTLFNRYYYRQIYETTDVNSKMIECYMRLRPSDIHNLSFRPLYFIKDAYYRLYEVVDHNYTDTTLCRFLKINEATPITNAVTTTKGGRGTITGTTDKTPTKAGIPTDWVRRTDQIGGNGGTVVADGNIGTGWNDAKSGGQGTLTGGLYKGEILKDKTVYLGFQYMSVASGSTVLTGFEGSPLYVYADTSAGNVLLYLPNQTDFAGSVIYTVKTHASHQLQVYTYDDVLVHTCTPVDESHQFLLTPDGVITYG